MLHGQRNFEQEIIPIIVLHLFRESKISMRQVKKIKCLYIWTFSTALAGGTHCATAFMG